MHWPDIFQLHVGIIHQQARESRVNDEAFWMFEVSFDGNFAIGCAMARDAFHVKRGEQKRIERNVLQTDLAGERIWIGEAERVAAGETTSGHRGMNFKLCHLAIRAEIAIEAADHLLSNAEVHNTEAAFARRR